MTKNVVSCVTVKCPPQVVLDVIAVPSVETAGMDPQVKSARGAFVYTRWKRTRECVWMGGWLLAAGMGFFCFFLTEWEMRGVGVNYGTMRFLFPFFLDRIKVKVSQVLGRVQLYSCLTISCLKFPHCAKSLPVFTNISGVKGGSLRGDQICSDLLFWQLYKSVVGLAAILTS